MNEAPCMLCAMNWTQTIRDLQGLGWSFGTIAKECGVSRSAVSDLCSGRTVAPLWGFAESLRGLHKREMRKAARRAAA